MPPVSVSARKNSFAICMTSHRNNPVPRIGNDLEISVFPASRTASPGPTLHPCLPVCGSVGLGQFPVLAGFYSIELLPMAA